MKNVKSKVIVAMCIALLVMATGYAYFVTNLSITSTGNITSGWNVKFVSITEGNNGGTEATNASIPTYTDTTATMSVNLTSPGDYMEYEIVLQNTGDIDATIEEITTSEAGSDAIIFTVSRINDGDPLVKGDSKTIKVKIEYDPTITSQPTETTKTLTIGIKAVQIVNGNTGTNTPGSSAALLANKILQDNTAQADTAIDFGAISSDTNGKGLYYTSTNTEGNKTTYYFRGDVENNYVKFGTQKKGVCTYNDEVVVYGTTADMITTAEQCRSTTVCTGTMFGTAVGLTADGACAAFSGTDTGEYATFTEIVEDLIWRIVRINEDGSIRLITEDKIGTSFFAVGNQQDGDDDDNAYVGYMYGEVGASGDDAYKLTHANANNSAVKETVDDWYINQSNLNNYSSLMSTTAGFCNDRSIAESAGLWYSNEISPDTALGYGKNTTYYGAYNRLVNEKQPQFKCKNIDNDLFTTGKSSTGNRALTYPVGLLTADEVVYAGTPAGKTNSNMYLSHVNNAISGYGGEYMGFLTMSPINFEGISTPYEIDIYTYSYNFGFGRDSGTNVEDEIRPVINLSSTVELSTELPAGCTKLDGTAACPYIIKTN